MEKTEKDDVSSILFLDVDYLNTMHIEYSRVQSVRKGLQGVCVWVCVCGA
jgi:hypothetical protein